MEVGRAFLGSGCHEGSQNEHPQTKAEETGFCLLASGSQKPKIQGSQGGPLEAVRESLAWPLSRCCRQLWVHGSDPCFRLHMASFMSVSPSVPYKDPHWIQKVKMLVTQSCPTLCNPTDCSPPGPSVHGILHARILERVAMPFSRSSS